jgi:DNA-3-methyladenine glycosylase I
MSAMETGLVVGDDGVSRCWWSGEDPLYRSYHDTEWGWPERRDQALFEKICLEGFQSGLSWLTILRKRENFRSAFQGFDPSRIAGFDGGDVERLMSDAGIVRNRAKILSTINNAARCLETVEEWGSLAAYVWSFEPPPEARPGRLDHSRLMTMGSTAESKAMSKDMKRRGWSFVGPTTAYAAMEAMGVVNDHIDGCSIRPLVESARTAFARPMPKT